MRVDHVNLTVRDVTEVSAFLKKHFGYSDAFEDNNDNISVLGDGHGMHINLMRGRKPTYPKAFHIGFDAQTEAEVNAAYKRLTNDGLTVKPPQHAWGSYTFHFTCPGGDFVIEVACVSENTSSE
jgi:catechol 2,3-dioxygenase-like lactoylglutathione lyase family enzyme